MSDGITGSDAQVAQGGANTDALLIFYESSSNDADAVIICYQESGNDPDFDNELSVVAIFESVGYGDFDAANII